MKIECIHKNEIVKLADESLRKFASDIPITYPRSVSQSLNPDAKEDDILMIIAKEGNKLLSFIGVYPGRVKGDPGKRIYWVSCWWKARGVPSSVSHQVLQKFLEWTGKEVGLPHLPPHIIRILKKNRITILEREGIMIRFRQAFHKRSLQRSKKGRYRHFINLLRVSGILKLSDFMVNLFKSSTIIDDHSELTDDFHVEKSIPGDDYFSFIHTNFKNYLTIPDRENIQWILSHPWLVHPDEADPEVTARYHFSYISDDFHHFFPILKDNNDIVAAGFFSSREGAVKSLFLFVLPGYREKFIRNISLYIQSKSEYHTLITYDPIFLEILLKSKAKQIRGAEKIKRYTGIGNPDYARLTPGDADGDSCFT